MDALCSVRVAKAVKWKLAVTQGKVCLWYTRPSPERRNRARMKRGFLSPAHQAWADPTWSRCCPGQGTGIVMGLPMAALSNHPQTWWSTFLPTLFSFVFVLGGPEIWNQGVGRAASYRSLRGGLHLLPVNHLVTHPFPLSSVLRSS